MEIKVIIHDGIVVDVLSDAKGLNIEILDIDKDYEDYEKLQDYESELYADPDLKSVDYSVAHFEEEDSDQQ